jgi:hypothetical protein
MSDNCEKCGWPETVQADGTPMHCGRKYYQNDYAFCLEKQCEKLQRELNGANEMYRKLDIHALKLVDRITHLESALRRIANQDYRGNRSEESQIAAEALKP